VASRGTVLIGGNEATLDRAIDALRDGAIVAVKGIGGYQLLCDARNDGAVRDLRDRKRRPTKPLAVLFARAGADELDGVRRHCAPDVIEARSLQSPARPIVLVRRLAASRLSPALAPGPALACCRSPRPRPAARRFMRDPTRGGIATVAHEIALETGYRVVLDETSLPIGEPVRGVCDMLGYDPLYLACEGRVVAAVDPAHTEALLTAWGGLPGGAHAATAGWVERGRCGVGVRTLLGGERLLEDDPLPRVC